MNAPEKLTRPLAARVANLPEPIDHADNPQASQAVIDAAVDALRAGKTHYTDRPGILPLREQVSKMLGENYGVELSADEITITCGATEARFVAIKQFVKSGKQVLCIGVSSAIEGAAQLVGTQIVREITDPSQIAALYCTPLDDTNLRQSVLDHAARNGWWIIYDTSIQPESTFHPAQNATLASQVLTVGSLSDALPGWRVGWMAGSKMANKLRAYKQSMTICTTSISQWAGLGVTK